MTSLNNLFGPRVIKEALTPRRREALLALCIFTLATVIFLKGSIFLGLRLVPADVLALSEPWRSTVGETDLHNPTLVDPIQTHYPRQLYFWGSVKQGHFPIWNPYIYLGLPCDPMTIGVFADTGQWLTALPMLILPLDFSLGIVAALRLVLAGFFMYLLMRHLRASFGGGLLAALVFMFSGNTVAWLEFNQHLAAQLWMPLVLLFFDRMLTRHRWEDALLAAVFLALMLYNWYLQLTLYMLLVLFPFFLWHLWRAYRQERNWRIVGTMVLMTATATGSALLMASVKLFTYYQTTTASIRGQQLGGRLRPVPFDLPLLSHIISRVTTFAVPTIYGDGIAHNYWGPGNAVENMQYIGLFSLYLIAIALACKPRRRGLLFFTGASLCLYMIRLGVPLFTNLARLIPMFSAGSATRLITVVTFLLAIAAGLGLTDLEERRCKTRAMIAATIGTLVTSIAILAAFWGIHYQRISSRSYVSESLWILAATTAITILLIGLAYLRRVSRQWVVTLAILLTFADLFVAGANFNTTIPPQVVYPATKATDFLRRDPAPYRVLVLYNQPNKLGITPSDTLQAYQIPEIGGRDPHLPQQYYDFISQVMEEPVTTPNGHLMPARFENPTLWGMLNVKYVLSKEDLPREQLDRLHLVYADELKIYRNKDWLPRMSAVPSFRVLESREALVEALKNPVFDPRNEVLLLQGPTWKRETSPPCEADDVRIDWVGMREAEGWVCLSQPNLVVLSSRYDPAWQAHVDGERRTVYQVNDILMAVPVEAGEHTVRFAYAPPSRWWNLAARTVPPLLMAGVFWALSERAERKRGLQAASPRARWPVVALVALAAASFAPVLLQATLAERDLPSITQAFETTFGSTAALEGVVLNNGDFASKGKIALTLHWRALSSMDTSYTVFVHLVGPDGAIHAQRDAIPLKGGYPTNIWQPGEIVADHYVLTVPQEAPPGAYRLVVGLYNPATMERLPAVNVQGARWDGDGVQLNAVLLKPDP